MRSRSYVFNLPLQTCVFNLSQVSDPCFGIFRLHIWLVIENVQFTITFVLSSGALSTSLWSTNVWKHSSTSFCLMGSRSIRSGPASTALCPEGKALCPEGKECPEDKVGGIDVREFACSLLRKSAGNGSFLEDAIATNSQTSKGCRVSRVLGPLVTRPPGWCH